MHDAEATPPTQELPIAPDPARGPRGSGEARRFAALVAAVRAHRVVTGHSAFAMRPSDRELYRRLKEIESSGPSRERD
jgi:hypothetical protein